MEILKRFQAGRFVRQLQADANLTDSQRLEARSQLLAMGSAGVRALLGAVASRPASNATLQALGTLVRETTLADFLEALRSPHAAVAEAAMRALATATDYAPAGLLALFGDERISRARLETILDAQCTRLQPAALLALLPELGKEARNSAFRLTERIMNESAIPDAVALSQHPDWWLRLHMAKLLSRFPCDSVNAAVVRLIDDDNGVVRLEAVRAAKLLQAKTAIPALCTRLRDQDMKVQTAAIEALVGMADVTAVPHLLGALKDESEYVRRGAVEVLNEVVTVDAIKDLVNALRDADWWVRVRSADALGTLGGPRVVDAVLELTKDPDEFARRYAIEILNTVPDPRAVPALVEALEDDDWWVRERAVDALGKVGDASAVMPLLRVMGRDPRSLPLFVRALGAIGSPTVVEPLCQLADSEDIDVRREALQALVALQARELPDVARMIVLAALERAGVRAPRQNSRAPLDVRRGRSASAERPNGNPSLLGTPSGMPSAPGTPSHAASPASEPAREGPALNFQKLAVGTELIGRFRVLQRVGGGGFGTVYLVEDMMVKEDLVLKILSPHLSLDPNMIRRFVQELKLTRRITHANVIRIHDLLDLNGAHAISMEYFAGRDLGAVLREEGPLSPARAIHVAEQVLEGLCVAHTAGILHRDLKPANLLVGSDDLVKIVDFGLASVKHSTESRLTQSGILVGTPEYISPEQITGVEMDARSDLYSLGVVLYEALSGKQPFTGTTAVNILFQHLEADVQPLSAVAAGIPPALSDIVMRAMARQVADRPESAAAMLALVRAL